MSEWRSRKDDKRRFPVGTGSGEGVPNMDEEVKKIMADELKTVGFEGMSLEAAKDHMTNKSSRYLGNVEENGAEFHEWYSDFDGKYTWAVMEKSEDKIAFGGESKSGMLEANSGTASEQKLVEAGQSKPPEPEIVEVVDEKRITPEDIVDALVSDSAIEGPDYIASRDKGRVQKENKKAKDQRL